MYLSKPQYNCDSLSGNGDSRTKRHQLVVTLMSKDNGPGTDKCFIGPLPSHMLRSAGPLVSHRLPLSTPWLQWREKWKALRWVVLILCESPLFLAAAIAETGRHAYHASKSRYLLGTAHDDCLDRNTDGGCWGVCDRVVHCKVPFFSIGLRLESSQLCTTRTPCCFLPAG